MRKAPTTQEQRRYLWTCSRISVVKRISWIILSGLVVGLVMLQLWSGLLLPTVAGVTASLLVTLGIAVSSWRRHELDL